MSQKKEKTSSPDYPLLGRMIIETSGNEAVCKPSPGLYVVATPIGNLGDITLRALVILSHADVIACEDTRNSGNLLQAFGIKKPTFSYHDHNEKERLPEVMKRLSRGEIVALISDAGMPLIADPGFKLVRECRESGFAVTVIPGANAAITAMAGCGLPTDQFYFFGFLPNKSVARKKDLILLKNITATLVFYEAPQRLADTLNDLADILGSDRPVVVSRELTKFFEDTKRGTLAELRDHYQKNETKGEIVILVGVGEKKVSDTNIDALLEERLQKLSVRDAVAEIADITGYTKKDIYAKALAIAAKRK